jgi:hypothetical protein
MIYAHKVTDDNGGAPCVQDGILTQAICIPEIRYTDKNGRRIPAQNGDILVGIGGENIGKGRLIYVAKITKVIGPGSDHYDDPANRDRRDCVYKRGKNGEPVHRGPAWNHYKKNVKIRRPKDVGRNWQNARVLISTDFRYLGGKNDKKISKFILTNLRPLVEMSRVNKKPLLRIPLKIDSTHPLWHDINIMIQDLRKRYSSTHRGKATHLGDDPHPEDWIDYNKKVDVYRKQHP